MNTETWRRASSVSPRKLEWLWLHRIPKGTVTLLAGDGGLGKSTITADIAARVTQGARWPDGAPPHSDPQTVVIVADEDGDDVTVVPRLIAHGAKLDRVIIHNALDDFSLSRFDTIKGLLDECHPALLIIDPVDEYLGLSTDSWKSSSVRQALKPLRRLAHEYGVAILGIVHLNKGEQNSPLNRILGSVAFKNLARSVYGVAKDMEGRRYFGPLKGNLTRDDAAALQYTIEEVPHPTDPDDPDATLGRVQWGELVEVDMNALFKGLPTTPKSAKSQAARQLLLKRLAGGAEFPVTRLEEEAKSQGISESTLNRARKDLHVETVKRDGVWFARLPAALTQVICP